MQRRERGGQQQQEGGGGGGDGRRETETGDGRRETGDGRRETGDGSRCPHPLEQGRNRLLGLLSSLGSGGRDCEPDPVDDELEQIDLGLGEPTVGGHLNHPAQVNLVVLLDRASVDHPVQCICRMVLVLCCFGCWLGGRGA